jgi:urea transport system substrate-binding protein
LINKIKLKKPDVIYAIVVGGSNVSFYKQLKAAGITGDKQTLLTISVTEDEALGIGGENLVGFYSAMKYFQSLQNPNNEAFVKAFKAKYGEKSVIGDVTQAAYLGPWLWKMAVEKAGSFDVDKVAAASPGLEFKEAPEGYVKVHECSMSPNSSNRIRSPKAISNRVQRCAAIGSDPRLPTTAT